MSTASTVDPSTLGWVKSEIDDTLKQARLALEAYAEQPGDETRLRFFITHLHQVTGTLQMVELDGAALLSREVEALAEGVLAGSAEAGEAVFEALTRAILSLSDYLNQLLAGAADVPLRLLDLLNLLRGHRGAEPFSEYDLFNPDLSVYPPPDEGTPPPPEGENAPARLRARYQAALLRWLQGPEDPGPLADIEALLHTCQRQAHFGSVAQLWWVGRGLVEALRLGTVEASNEAKRQLSGLDQVLKRWATEGEAALVRQPPDRLVKQMLYFVGKARPEGTLVPLLRAAFDLGSVLPAEALGLGDVNAPLDALQSASEALLEEVTAAQGQLSAYFDPEGEVTELGALLNQLKRITSTLEALGLKPLRDLAEELAEATRALMDGRITDLELASLPMAGALLVLENGIRDMARNPRLWRGQVETALRQLRDLVAGRYRGDEAVAVEGIELQEGELSGSEFRDLLGVVAGEVRGNLEKVEEALEALAAAPERLELLEAVPAQLNQIQGALQMLGQERAADLVNMTREYIAEIRTGRVAVDHTVLDALAVAVSSIDAYMDGLRRERPDLSDIVDTALGELDRAITRRRVERLAPAQVAAAIEGHFAAWRTDPDDRTALRELKQGLRDLAVMARYRGDERLGHLAAEVLQLLEVAAEDPDGLAGSGGDTLARSIGAVSARAEALAPAPEEAGVSEEAPEEASMPPPPAAEDGMDESILEIFLEEARSVLEALSGLLPRWRNEPDGGEVLAEIRRGFHTLKGSGRLAGALDIGELAWTVEDLLNRVIKGSVPSGPDLWDFVEEARGEIARLAAGYADGHRVYLDLPAWQGRAQALAAGGPAGGGEAPAPAGIQVEEMAGGGAVEGPVEAERPGAAGEAEAPPAPGEGEEEEEGAASTPSRTVEIFVREARGHLSAIRKALGACREAGEECQVTAELLRAAHTLEGSARSVGLPAVGAVAEAIEETLAAHARQGRPPVAELLGEVEAACGLMEQAVAALAAGGTPDAELEMALAGASGRLREYQDRDAGDRPWYVPGETPVPADAPAGTETPAAGAAAELSTEESADLQAIFVEEAADSLGAMEEALGRWRAGARDLEAVDALKRALHTLKGSARAVGAEAIGGLAHDTEGLLERIERGERAPEAGLAALLEEVHDSLLALVDSLQAGTTPPDVGELHDRVRAAMSGGSRPAGEGEHPATAGEEDPPETAGDGAAPAAGADGRPDCSPATGAEAPAGAEGDLAGDGGAPPGPARGGEEAPPPPGRGGRGGAIRVNPLLLDNLSNYAGEVSITRSRIQQQVLGFRENLKELRASVNRFRDQIRDLEIQAETQILARPEQEASEIGAEFDPLEFDRYSKLQYLSRSLAESLNDLATIQAGLDANASAVETTLVQQARLSTELQEGLIKTRLVAFATHLPRLRHLARQSARELGRHVEVEFRGAEVEVDRNLLERMLGPLEHMIRNAIDHGIEPPEARRAAGKPEAGRLVVEVARQGHDVVIQVADDGRGLDVAAIRRRALERGLIQADSELGEGDLYQLIMTPGFTTRTEVTLHSGRGVGLDVVQDEVRQLGGRIRVESEPGRGTRFSLYLPVSLALMQALVVEAGGQPFALPVTDIVNILKVAPEALAQDRFTHLGQSYPRMVLRDQLGLPASEADGGKRPVVLARAGEQEVALVVDRLVGTQEIVVKPLGPQIAGLPAVEGATVLGDGSVVLILDLAGLWAVHAAAAPRPPAADDAPRPPVVMVVDDSLTVRTVTDRHLRKHGMEVVLAKDGVDALEQLRRVQPDVMLIDIEMPRMDGYELTTRLRADPATARLPIMIITSRAGAKHKQKAMELGADIYLTKPYQEDALMAEIEKLLAGRRLH